MTTVSLRRLRLRSGEEHRDEYELELAPFDLGGERYLPVPERVPAGLAVARGVSGTTFDVRFDVRLHGPCQRCLEDAVVDREIRGREYHASDPRADEELRSQYVRDDQLELSEWARDLLAEALPDQILCREDCAGLCPICGEDLNRNRHEHDEERGDPRWAALERLREQL